ncbi:MAG: TolC family protein [Bryobacteraceae bacterium]
MRDCVEWNQKFVRAAALVVLAAVTLQAQSGFEGSVAEGTAGPEIALTMQDAIQRGLKANLGLLLTDQQLAASRGARTVALSRLLPDINAGIHETSEQVNLAAFGFSSFPGIPAVVGPFNVLDVRASLSQAILNLRALDAARASSQNMRAAELQYKDARDSVVLLVTAFYLQAQAAESRIDTAQAQVTAAEALFRQAQEFKSAGTVPAIDVLRAQVELQAQRHRLIANQNDFEKQKLKLGRAIGLPDGQTIRMADKMPYSPEPAPAIDDALKAAYQSRMDYQSLEARVRAAEFNRKGTAAQRYPTVNFNGDYGAIGQSPVSNHGTYTAVFSLNVPVFDSGRIRGEVEQADAALRQQKMQLDDLRGRIGYELRSALLDLQAAHDQVEAAASAVSLSKQQVEQARDRFAAGVTNNLEVVQAQEALAGANENHTSSLYAYNIARASLARAMGGMGK